MNFVGTFWSLVPPIIAIALALITKEVYISLFIGILTGALLFTGFAPVATVETLFEVMTSKLADSWNIGILIFLVFLGIIVALMTKAGGSAAYGNWAIKKIKTKKGALLSTFGLGALIFVDDYFNCLTVGSVMRPVTDKFSISRAKLAYVIDATAAPICIIAPISSWAAAVTGYTSGDGFSLFLQTIPFNLYAWLTMAMVVYISISGRDFGPMKKHENAAKKGDVFCGINEEVIEQPSPSSKGKVIDLVLPVAFLILSCITSLIYTGGFFDGVPFITAFSECDPSLGLVFGSFITLIFIFILYIPRRIIKFKEFADCIPQGFKMMISAILILILAWTLGGFCADKLEAGAFVQNALHSTSIAEAIFPATLFIIALGLAFATGTSWGTFAILIPIVTAVFPEGSRILVITISSVLAGAVCGDHISPISDTTIMASAGAQCNHVAHVSTQIPYALTIAVCCFLGYIVAGISKSFIATAIVSVVLFVVAMYIVSLISKKENINEKEAK
ncbi:Na+/H+ antiporter NhaC family protein [Sedimentibacter sp. zth1]|uniref:Na+/H+ antiporter NhaC family protein n=1 Tax=Sedimentibacter sp. zth1 TaxID=2816908 RepID=UPI001A9361A7|nr:Na+/H+ antiporter NhaC family protein [Sedimentibacter sp. zth1]QSX06422.1 Na+/H+ antiporter NhaC family protein [Sedimentibacter sp. zth1]